MNPGELVETQLTEDDEPVGFGGDLIRAVQSISGPILIGLFALAVRQRLKR